MDTPLRRCRVFAPILPILFVLALVPARSALARAPDLDLQAAARAPERVARLGEGWERPIAYPLPPLESAIVIGSDSTFTAGSTHIFTDTLVVADGATLTIEPGVRILFDLDVIMVVYGGLRAVGTPDSMITFRGVVAETFRWGSMGIFEADGPVEMRHCHLRRTHRSDWFGQALVGTISPFDSHIIITDCVFDDLVDGAIWFERCTGEIARNTFTNVDGSAVYGNNSDVDIIDNFFGFGDGDPIDYNKNTAPNLIHGNIMEGSIDDCIDVDDFVGTVTNNRLTGCLDKGVSVSMFSVAKLENNLIWDAGQGYGVTAGSVAEVWNTTIFDCLFGIRAEERHAGFGGATVTGANVILWGSVFEILTDTLSTVTLTYSDVEGDTVLAGEGNISADPLFVDPLAGDLHLAPGSPCIDAALGDGANEADFEGDLRIDDPATPNTGTGMWTFVDMGADEYWPETTEVTLGGPPAPPALVQVRPNPVTASGELHLGSPRPAHGTLRLFDVRGRLRRVWSSVAVPGAIAWDGRDFAGHRLARGVYFLQLTPDASPAGRLTARVVVVH